MLHAERPRLMPEERAPECARLSFRELLLAVAPPPEDHSIVLTGWPDWLVPTYRSGGHRLEVHLLEEER